MIADARQVCRTVRGREQRYVYAQVSQRHGKIVDDPLGAAMVFGGSRENVRRDLCDANYLLPLD